MKARMFWKVNLTIIYLASSPLLAQQFLESRLAELDRQGKYAEALALCERNIDLSVAAYFAGEYTYHGRISYIAAEWLSQRRRGAEGNGSFLTG